MKQKPKPGRPQFGRTPWGWKPRDVSRQAYLRGIRLKFDMPPFSKAFWQGHSMVIDRGLEKVPDAEKWAFLARNAGVAAKVFDTRNMHIGQITQKRMMRIVKNPAALEQVKGKELDTWVVDTHKTIALVETADFEKKISSHLAGYFKARKIPIKTEAEKLAFRTAVSLFFSARMKNVVNRLNLAEMEQVYLRTRKLAKTNEQLDAEDRNALFREIFGKERLTANQRRAAKRWLRANFAQMKAERVAAMFKMVQGGLRGETVDAWLERTFSEFLAAGERLKQRAQAEVLNTFKPVEKKPAAQNARQPEPGFKKAGTRAERMAAYKAMEKSPDAKKKEIREERERARIGGKSFDATSYVLNEMKAGNSGTAKFFESLLKSRALGKESLVKLFISGSLTQKVFQTVANDAEFDRNFGSAYIDLLAKGLAFIGPKGKQTERVRKALQGKKGKQLFEFLERRGYIDTQHSQRVVTYLKRL